MPRGPKKHDLAFYLIKPEAADFQAALSEPDQLQSFPVGDAAGFEGTVFTRNQRITTPWWLGFLRGGNAEIGDMTNASTAAILCLKVDSRMFAIPFGYGRNLFALDMVVRDFGLKVALNTIHPETLRSVDARTFEELSVAKKTQASRPTGLESFSLNRSEEILKAVTGTPRDSNFAHRITGADAAKLTYSPTVIGLPDKCRQLLLAYTSDAYKQRFDFIDYMREVRDGSLIHHLDTELVWRLRGRNFDALHMAPPEASDWSEFEAFVFDRKPEDQKEDLEPENYVGLFANPGEISINTLVRDRVGVVFDTASEPSYRWRVYDAIVCEVREGGSLHVLTSGSWYRIEETFAGRVFEELSAKTVDVDFLPPAGSTEKEPAYNQRACGAPGRHLFDEKLVCPKGATTTMELCDLITDDRYLVHVKRKSRSSTLSHLFAQGVTAAETFYSDEVYRQRLKEKVAAEVSAAAAELIPKDRPTPNDWTVLFAIITSAQRQWPQSLPFFSQLNFRNASERLSRFGFRVGLTRIPTQ